MLYYEINAKSGSGTHTRRSSAMDDGMLWALFALAIAAMLGIDLAFGASGLLLRRRRLRREARDMRPLLDALHASSGPQPHRDRSRREVPGMPRRDLADGPPAALRLAVIQGGHGKGGSRWGRRGVPLAPPAAPEDRSAPAATAGNEAGQWRMAARR
jgi:hypothetical protein